MITTPTTASTAAHANPASAFYASSRTARILGIALRTVNSLAPALGTRAALRLFFTPLPWKLAARHALPQGWSVTSWPFEAVSLAAYTRNDIAAGLPTVLLLHGWGGSGMQMRTIGDQLAASGFNPVLLDFPAHGRSAGWRSTLPQFTRAIYAAASRLGPLHAIVAHSLGAIAALHVAARGLAVDRLVLVSPSASPTLFLHWFAGSFGLSDAAPLRMGERIEQREGIALSQFESDWLGPRVAQPCLVIHDETDRVAPFSAGQRATHALVDARLHATQGLGHRRVLEDAGVAQETARHLQQRGSEAERVRQPGRDRRHERQRNEHQQVRE